MARLSLSGRRRGSGGQDAGEAEGGDERRGVPAVEGRVGAGAALGQGMGKRTGKLLFLDPETAEFVSLAPPNPIVLTSFA